MSALERPDSQPERRMGAPGTLNTPRLLKPMIQDHKVPALIAARGGCKRLRDKNVLESGGKPMVAWSIGAGQGSRYIDRLILSSDDDEIMDIARRWNCEVPYRRPDGLAGDSARIEDTLAHVIPPQRSMDADSEIDLLTARAILSSRA